MVLLCRGARTRANGAGRPTRPARPLGVVQYGPASTGAAPAVSVVIVMVDRTGTSPPAAPGVIRRRGGSARGTGELALLGGVGGGVVPGAERVRRAGVFDGDAARLGALGDRDRQRQHAVDVRGVELVEVQVAAHGQAAAVVPARTLGD